MCRLFGFRSVINSQVHQSLVNADNALGTQSNLHPDGWGVAYYLEQYPHLIKSDKTALDDAIFKKVSGIVSSQTVLAHIRKATQGQINTLNTHPFQFGPWSFAHNGHIVDFAKHKSEIESHISPDFKKYILGSTDSEYMFYFLLSKLSLNLNLFDPDLDIASFSYVFKKAIKTLVKITGEFSKVDTEGANDNFFTLIICNAKLMLALQGGKTLKYSTHKSRCPERDSCSSFSPACEAPTTKGKVNHLIVSSESLSGENIWYELLPGEIVGTDHHMNFFKDAL